MGITYARSVRFQRATTFRKGLNETHRGPIGRSPSDFSYHLKFARLGRHFAVLLFPGLWPAFCSAHSLLIPRPACGVLSSALYFSYYIITLAWSFPLAIILFPSYSLFSSFCPYTWILFGVIWYQSSVRRKGRSSFIINGARTS